AALLAVARTELTRMLPSALADLMKVLAAWRSAEKALTGRADLHTLPALTDMKSQVERLVHRGFLAEAGAAQLRHYPRYLAAVEQRRDKLGAQIGKDRQMMDQLADLQGAWLHQMEALAPGRPPHESLRKVRWMLEEYRVQLWAQQLGTAQSVSDQRIRKALG